MAVPSKLKFADVKKVIGENLKTALDIVEFSITYAKLEEDVWKVNVEFKEKIGGIDFPISALFTIDSITGEVKEFGKGRRWGF